MGIYRGLAPLKAYKGDMQPVNVYKGSTKVAGWHAASYSGTSPLTVDCDYNVPPDALTIDGRCSQMQSCWGTNLVTNGDFSNGTTGWLALGANLSIVNGVAQVLATAQWGRVEANHRFTIPANHAYYCSALVMANTPLAKLTLELPAPPYTVFGYNNVSAVGLTSRISFVANKPSSDTSNVALRINDGRTSAFDTFTVDYVIMIDLTSAFGAGKEPTAAQMDAIMAQFPNSWFDGSAQLSTDTTTYTPNSPSPSFPAPISTITGDVTITGADGEASDTVTVAFGSAVCASLPDGTHDSYDAVSGVLTKRVGKVVFDGSADENWVYSNQATRAGVLCYVFYITNSLVPAQTAQTSISDRFIIQTNLVPATLKPIDTTVLYLAIESSRLTSETPAALRTWLSANPVTVYYRLATPTTVQLTPHLPVVRTGIKTLTVGADVVPKISATVKSMD